MRPEYANAFGCARCLTRRAAVEVTLDISYKYMENQTVKSHGGHRERGHPAADTVASIVMNGRAPSPCETAHPDLERNK